MIIAGVAVRECPESGGTSKAVRDVGVLGDVLGVVDVGEGVLVDRRIDCNRDDGQQQAEKSGTKSGVFEEKARFAGVLLLLEVRRQRKPTCPPCPRRVYPIGFRSGKKNKSAISQ